MIHDGRTEGRGRQAARLRTTNICDVRISGRRAKSNAAKRPRSGAKSGCRYMGLSFENRASPWVSIQFSTEVAQKGAPWVKTRLLTARPALAAAWRNPSGVN